MNGHLIPDYVFKKHENASTPVPSSDGGPAASAAAPEVDRGALGASGGAASPGRVPCPAGALPAALPPLPWLGVSATPAEVSPAPAPTSASPRVSCIPVCGPARPPPQPFDATLTTPTCLRGLAGVGPPPTPGAGSPQVWILNLEGCTVYDFPCVSPA